MVTLTRKSMITGEMNTMTLDTTQDKIDLFFTENDRPLIQDLFPELTVDEREFIQTGSTPEDWNNLSEKELNETTVGMRTKKTKGLGSTRIVLL
jgi:hypothetical protein